MTASVELLGQLHDMVTKELLRRIESGEATAADIGQAIKLLKDNNIEAIAAPGSGLEELTKSLVSKLPFADQDMDFQH